jgi:hypothetical protein
MKICEFKKSRFLLNSISPNKKTECSFGNQNQITSLTMYPIIYGFDLDLGCEVSFNNCLTYGRMRGKMERVLSF